MFICESDVIWKFHNLDQIDLNFFLHFPAAKNAKKIAYAPAISKAKMEGELLKQFKELVDPFDAISTRDKEAAIYLTTLLKRDCPYVLDPTLLLNEEHYTDILISPTCNKEYILIYNCTVNDIKMVRTACQFAKEHKLKVIEISNYAVNRFIVNHKVINDAGLEQWLGWFKNSKYIITNSFHGICFSIIFKKQFIVYQRDNSDYRFTDILINLGLEKCLIPYDEKGQRIEQLQRIDYKSVYERLQPLREKSLKYIEQSIASKI